MNLAQVEAFCTIAECGSVSEAARQLDCNRTKLSMSIKALEKDLDVELFLRTGNQLMLSEAGKAIYKDCENLLVTAQRIKKTCAQVSDGVQFLRQLDHPFCGVGMNHFDAKRNGPFENFF